MSELHDKARALLGLKSMAPRGPWMCFGKDHDISVIGGDGSFSLFRIDCGGRAAMEFAAAAHEMADTIAELLAKNKHLAASAQIWENQAAKQRTNWDVIRIRAEAAEERLRELCEVEPAGYQWLDTAHFRRRIPNTAAPGEFTPLIPRPSMPGVGK